MSPVMSLCAEKVWMLQSMNARIVGEIWRLRELAPRLDPEKHPLSVLVAPGMTHSKNEADREIVPELHELGAKIVEADLRGVLAEGVDDIFRPFHTVVSCSGFGGPRHSIKKDVGFPLTST